MHSTMVRNEMAWDKGWPRLYMWGQTLWALEDFNQMTLDDLAGSNFLVNNLFQIDANLWQANLRLPAPDGDYFTGWGQGPTYEAALDAAYAQIGEAEFVAERKATGSIAPNQSLRSLVGLKPAPSGINILRRQL